MRFVRATADRIGQDDGAIAEIDGAERRSKNGRAILQMIELPALWTILPHKAQIKRKVELLSQAGVVDAEWYLKHYDDVAKSGADPMEHYIKYGANEGRLPNGSL
ncbi:hypothetical protein [Shinella zoogloeoides]|uniref:hypothetical protein n=1 Tax=Shinella zoogloeoides TaxID=352475 RepID=UPI00273ECBE3|nr:hypothetical protein [Shinella zoogloeoides]WLR94853.1 hypothetical protein Q9316_12350 [Shinella zoogloeoides]